MQKIELKPHEIEMLRTMNDQESAKILGYSTGYICKIRNKMGIPSFWKEKYRECGVAAQDLAELKKNREDSKLLAYPRPDGIDEYLREMRDE